MSNTRVINNALDGWVEVISQLEVLDAKTKLTEQETRQRATLLAKASLLKQGINPSEVQRAQVARLYKELGWGWKMPAERETGLNQDWRDRIRELRASNVKGTQTITYTEETQGGALVSQEMSARCFETMKQYDQVFDPRFSNIIETEDGANLPVPAFDDVASASTLVGENTLSTDTKIANVGVVQLGSYNYRSGRVILSMELERDGNFPWGTLLERVFGKRHARGIGAAMITGSGNGAPTGLVTAVLASGVSPVIAAGSSSNDGLGTSTNSIGTQDLAALYGKLDPAYRPSAAWYMNDATLVKLMELLDKMGRPVVHFVEGATGMGEVPYIYGKPVAICPSMDAIGATKNTVVFGNPDYFIQRRVPKSMYVNRYWQSGGLVEAGLIAYESFLRVDSNLLAPNSSYLPYQILQQHS